MVNRNFFFHIYIYIYIVCGKNAGKAKFEYLKVNMVINANVKNFKLFSLFFKKKTINK
jgi:hypothetical protein